MKKIVSFAMGALMLGGMLSAAARAMISSHTA